MKKDLQERLEEAADIKADQYLNDCMDKDLHTTVSGDFKKGFIAGAEQGYKEAIKVAIEWIEKNKQPVLASEIDDTIVGYSIDVDKILSDFETDMNKLWEKQK